eukprot:jgi/Ulvmu1/8495/UM044_0029.1
MRDNVLIAFSCVISICICLNLAIYRNSDVLLLTCFRFEPSYAGPCTSTCHVCEYVNVNSLLYLPATGEMGPLSGLDTTREWATMDVTVRKALDQLATAVSSQAWEIRQLQEGIASKDAMLNELRYKADQAAVDQLSKRTQAVNDTASAVSLTQKSFESRLIAVEKRIEYELMAASDTRPQPLVTAVNAPADTSTSWEPIFQASQTSSPAAPGPRPAAQEPAIASRMATVERKLAGLQGACIGLEEDSSAVVERVESLEGRLTAHAEEAMGLYATAAQLKDSEARCVTRAGTAVAAAEERAVASAAASARTSAEQSQSRLDSLRDCMHAELSALKAQVVEKAEADSLEAEIAALRSSHAALGSTVKALAGSKADRDGVDTRLEGFRKAVEDMKASVLAHIAERAAARSADVKAALDAAQGAERRAEALEGAVSDARTAAVRAGASVADVHDGLEEVRPAVEALQRALWGARGAAGSGADKAVVDALAEVQAAQRHACHADALAVVKDLAVQAHDRADALSKDVQQLAMADVSAALPAAVQHAVHSALAQNLNATQAVPADLAERLTRLEAASTAAAAAPAACAVTSASPQTAVVPACRTAAAGMEPGRRAALQGLVEMAVEDLEARLAERFRGQCRPLDEAIKRLSKRLTAELSGAHAMITHAMAEQGSATEALRAEVAARMHDEAGAALAGRQDLQASVDRLAGSLETVQREVEDRVTPEAARRVAAQEASTAVQAEEAQRTKRDDARFQAWLEKIGEQIDGKADLELVNDAAADAAAAARDALDAAAAATEEAVRSLDAALRAELQSVAGELRSAQAVTMRRVDGVEDGVAQAAASSQVKALQAAVVDKADRADMLSAVSSLQAALGQKAERAEAEAALARKLDVRTFLASQASMPSLDALSVGPSGAAAAVAAAPLGRSRSALRPGGSGPLTPAASLVRAHSAATARGDDPAGDGESPHSARSPMHWDAAAAARPPLPSSSSMAAGRLGSGVATGTARDRPAVEGVQLQSMQAVQQWRERSRMATPARLPSAASGLRTPVTPTPKGSQGSAWPPATAGSVISSPYAAPDTHASEISFGGSARPRLFERVSSLAAQQPGA